VITAAHIVQSAWAHGGSAGTTVTFSAAGGGNLLLAVVSGNNGMAPIQTPSGWNQLFQVVAPASGRDTDNAVYWEYAAGGETSQSFNASSGDNLAIVLYEISGANSTNPFDLSAYNDSVTSTPALTPTQLNDLPIAINYANDNLGYTPTIDSGFSVDQYTGGGSYHGIGTAHGPATADTVTPISPTFAWESQDGMTALLLIAGR
jgi:hypothetical protein